MFLVPVADRFLFYAPLDSLIVLIDRTAARQLRRYLDCRQPVTQGPLQEIVQALDPARELPLPRQGDFVPSFLGLLPTRGCNLACRYCGFAVGEEPQQRMSLELARDAVNWYLDTVQRAGGKHAEIHFFGGEPFYAPEVVDFAVHLGRTRAREAGLTVRFEVATNGVFDERRCRWIADNLDAVVLSLDGPPDVQALHRPYRDGRSSAEVVERTAEMLSEGPAALYLRACVTDATVERMPEIAAWFCERFRPAGVCFEPLQPPTPPARAPFEPPDPWAFGRAFVLAARILEAHGIEAVYAAADIHTRRTSFCPVGQDTAIVSPDGTISACYLLPRDWEMRGLDLRLGRIAGGQVHLDRAAVAAARALNVYNKPHCARCFCRWHCAGGCHVNHGPTGPNGAYDRLCIQTRLIALRNLLQALDQEPLFDAWLQDPSAVKRAILQPSDRLLDVEV